jgi:hypothetical protein
MLFFCMDVSLGGKENSSTRPVVIMPVGEINVTRRPISWMALEHKQQGREQPNAPSAVVRHTAIVFPNFRRIHDVCDIFGTPCRFASSRHASNRRRSAQQRWLLETTMFFRLPSFSRSRANFPSSSSFHHRLMIMIMRNARRKTRKHSLARPGHVYDRRRGCDGNPRSYI